MSPDSGMWDALSSPEFYASVVATAAGGSLPHFKLWFTPEAEVRNRCRALCEIWNEAVNRRLQDLLKRVLELPQVGDLRGAPPGSPDYVADYTKELFQIFTRRQELRSIESMVENCHTLVFGTFSASVICVVGSFFLPTFRHQIAMGAIVLLLIQVLAVIRVRQVVRELSQHESRN
jgi:hypothetical protein